MARAFGREGARPRPSAAPALYSAPMPGPRRFPPGPREVLAAPSDLGRGPPPPARPPTGADCPQCAAGRVAPPGPGTGPPLRKGVRGPRRCRQPTRPVLKHGPRSLTRARVGGPLETPTRRNESEGGAGRSLGRPQRWDPGPSGYKSRAHHRPVSPAASGRWSLSARDRTRKMVNYAWAGRSQRKLWWRPAAVLTCKSVVRPGYRGERLIEPSSSWFLPKFPSG